MVSLKKGFNLIHTKVSSNKGTGAGEWTERITPAQVSEGDWQRAGSAPAAQRGDKLRWRKNSSGPNQLMTAAPVSGRTLAQKGEGERTSADAGVYQATSPLHVEEHA